MNAETFIRKNPFPKNGRELNDQLVRDIQDPKKIREKNENIFKLFRNNARLISIVYKQHNYNQELDSVMSYVFEGISKAVESFDPKVGMPFYHYALKVIRGIMQNNYNYHEAVIHVPVMKKKDFRMEYCDINDYTEHESMAESEDENDQLTELLAEYEAFELSNEEKSELEILKMARVMTLKDISYKTGMNTVKVKKIISSATDKLKNLNREILSNYATKPTRADSRIFTKILTDELEQEAANGEDQLRNRAFSL
jgi:RNA polymerase sigma factor (sigma-70 family)